MSNHIFDHSPKSEWQSKKSLLLGGIASCALIMSPLSAEAGPTGGAVVSGQASISQNGSTTTIEQFSDRAVIEWQDFSIGKSEIAQFLQNNADSAVLNKVISSLPSNIMGQLKANGNVFLINPNGVVIGNGAQINANSFIASTLNITNSEFMQGGDLTFTGESTAAIINLGEVTAGKGDIYLLARQIKNAGALYAPQGEVGLAAGSEIYLSAERTNGSRITVKANKFAAELKDKIAIENTGAIEAARAILTAYNGDIYDLAINNSGTVKATGLSKNADGTISLFSTTSGNQSSGKIRNSGKLIAQNQDGSGGNITVSAREIELTETSHIDASAAPSFTAPLPAEKPAVPATAENRGNNGGGTILIGGNYQGQGELATAQLLDINYGSIIKANAGESGTGGKVIAWGDKETNIAGSFEAKGGIISGNGGFIETSGKETLKVDESTMIDISAAHGKGGAWLLDPTDITISDTGGDVSTATINTTLNGGGDVTITTASAASDQGDINLTNATIDKSTTNNDAVFKLVANRNISSSNTTIGSTSGDALSVIFNANSQGTGGAISLTDTTINTSGGDVIMGGGSDPLTHAAVGVNAGDEGVTLNNTQISNGAGDIFIKGQGANNAAASNQYGLYLHSGSVLQTTDGEIHLHGTGGAGEDENIGVYIRDSGTEITSVDGTIDITGQGGSNGATGSGSNFGVFVQRADITSTGTGEHAATITLNGTGGAGDGSNRGINLNNSYITSVDGAIDITGQGGSNGATGSNSNYGIYLNNSADIVSAGEGEHAATITLDGTGGAGEDDNIGLFIAGGGASILSSDGDILITARGGSNGTDDSDNNVGMHIETSGSVRSLGEGKNAANIYINATGGAGDDGNHGVHLRSPNSFLTAVNGSIYIKAQGGSNGTNGSRHNIGIYLESADITSTGTGVNAATITLKGTGGAGEDENIGVYIRDSGTEITSVDGAIDITGQGGSNGEGGSRRNYGVYLTRAAAVTSTGTGADAATITLDGTGGAGEDNNYGVYVDGGGTEITSTDGAIDITGQGGSNGSDDSRDNQGIFLLGGAKIASTGTANNISNINLVGTGGAGEGDDNSGLRIQDEGTLITSVYSNINIRGQGGSNGTSGSNENYGIWLFGGADITSTGTGADAATITLDGTGGAGEDNNYGVYVDGGGTEITSTDGAINITGQGGSNGAAGSGNNIGIFLANSEISTDNGPILLDGTGNGTGGNSNGIYVGSSNIQASSTGTIYIKGIANDTRGSASGITLDRTNIGVVDGDLTLIGTGAQEGNFSNGNHGIEIIRDTRITSSNLGNIFLQGNDGPNFSNDIRVQTIIDFDTQIGQRDDGVMLGDITMIGHDLSFPNTRIKTNGNIILKPEDANTSIGLGTGAGDFNLNNTELAYFDAGGRIIIGDSENATGHVNIDGVDFTTEEYDIYGGSIKFTNPVGLTSSFLAQDSFHALNGDIVIYHNQNFSNASYQQKLKDNFYTARDLVLAPNLSNQSDSIGIAGGSGTHTLSSSDLQGFQHIGRNLVIGSRDTGDHAIQIGSFDLSGESYGIGFHGSSIELQGDLTSGVDLKLAANSILFNDYDLTAQNDVIITSQNTVLDIGVSGGVLGPIDVTDTVINNIFAGNDGTGNLVIGDRETGSGIIDIAGLDLSGKGYGLKLYGGEIDFHDQGITTDADLTLGADTLSNFTSAMNAGGTIEIAPQTGVLMNIDEPANNFTLNGDTFSLGLLNNGSEKLILGSSRGGDVTWTSATHDFDQIDARTGGNLRLINTNAGASYGLGDGTSGDITYSTAQMESFQIGGSLFIGNAANGTGTIDVADLSAAELLYGLNASGGSIDIGGWNGGTGDITLNARTGTITSTESGTITGTNLNLTAAKSIGMAGKRLNTDVDALDYLSGGNVFIRDANALMVNSGAQTDAGTVDIATTNGQLSLAQAVTFRGDTLLDSGGAESDFTDLYKIKNAATSDSTLTIRAGRDITDYTAHTLENTNGHALDVILNADRDGNGDGAINLNGFTFNTNGGDFIAGGAADPLTGFAWGNDTNRVGLTLFNTNINTGAGDIILRGHGRNDFNGGNQYGIKISDGSMLTTTSGMMNMAGRGGNGDDNNYGIYINGADSGLSSIDGDIGITATAGSNGQTGSRFNHGFVLNNDATMTSTGTAGITLTATGGMGDSNNYGTYISDNGTAITTTDGDISIIGTGGSNGQTASSNNFGVHVRGGAKITSSGYGNMLLAGTGGDGWQGNSGIRIDNDDTVISSIDGDITLTGVGGSNGQTGSNGNFGVYIRNGAQITSTGTGEYAGNITLTGMGGTGWQGNSGIRIDNGGTEINAIDGDITFAGTGGSNGQTGSNGNTGVHIRDGANIISNGIGANAGNITLTGTGGAGDDANHGVYFENANTQITTRNGDISLTGIGGSNGQTGSDFNRGVYLRNEATITSAGTGANAGDITLNGVGGNGEDSTQGIYIEDEGTAVTTIDGDVTLTGIGGSNGQTGSINNYGIWIKDQAKLISTGIGSHAGNITLIGTGGKGEDGNFGIYVNNNNTRITAAKGDIKLIGTGGSNGKTGSNRNLGIQISSALIESSGTGVEAGNITLEGLGGAGEHNNVGVSIDRGSIRSLDGTISVIGHGNGLGDTNYGVSLSNPNTSITSTGGDISINGTGSLYASATSTRNRGVQFANNDTHVSSIDGNISVRGRSGEGLGHDDFLFYSDNAYIETTGTGNILIDANLSATSNGSGRYINASGTGDITYLGDEFNVSTNPGEFQSNANNGMIRFIPRTSDTTIGVVGGAGDLEINDGELAVLSAKGFVFGDSVNGTGAVDIGSLSIANGTDFAAYGGDISFVGGLTNARDLIFGGSSLTTNGLLSGSRDVSFDIGSLSTNSNISAGRNMVFTNLGSFSGQNIAASGDLGIAGKTILMKGGAVSTGGDLNINADKVTAHTGDWTVGANALMNLNALLMDGALNAGGDIRFIDKNLSVSGTGFTAGEHGYIAADTLALSAPFSAESDIIVVPFTSGTSIGMGDGGGQLSLSSQVLTWLLPSKKLIIGDQFAPTSIVNIDNLDLSGTSYDIELHGHSYNLNNGFRTGGNFYAQATGGDVEIYNGALQTSGATVLDIQQGAFRTNMGANALNVTGGSYILYTNSVFGSSSVTSLGNGARFVYNADSSSRPTSSLAPGQNYVIIRQGLGGAARDSGASEISNNILQVTTQPFVTKAPQPSVTMTAQYNGLKGAIVESEQVSDPSANNSNSGSIDIQEDPVNTDDTLGIGSKTNKCTVTAGRKISCNSSP